MKSSRIIFCLLAIYCFPRVYSSDLLKINEFMASNVHHFMHPDRSDFVDWIELYNNSDEPVLLGDYFITDDLSDPFKWRLPGDWVIGARSFFIIWADRPGRDQFAPFRLSADGEQIGLFNQYGEVMDTLTFGIQRDDVSMGRFPDGGDTWYYYSNPTFSHSNTVPGLASNLMVSAPEFSLEGGRYSGGQEIALSSGTGADIHYTLDGSLPDPGSPRYTGPIQLDTTTVVRARAFQDHLLPSRVVTHSFIIGDPTTLPVISITTPPGYLFDEEIGITSGICVSEEHDAPPPFDFSANYWQRWERPVHIEYFTPEGYTGLRQDAGIAIFGGLFGRQIRQKAFTLFARDKYGDMDFDFPLFPTKPVNAYRRFLLRASSNDFNRTFIRDAMMNTLVIGQMDVDYQAYQPAIVYINGEFWGLYNMREKTNQFYPEHNYGIDADSVEIVEGIDYPAHGDITHYREMIRFMEENDMSLAVNYEYIRTQMDVTEFMNYYITELYVNNKDWIIQNIRCWREHTGGARWRWMLYDLDWGFSNQMHWMTEEYKDNTLQWIQTVPEAFLFHQLSLNDAFRSEFAQRFVTHLNLTFRPERVHRIITGISDRILPEMPRQIERWGAIPGMEYWQEQLDILHQFAESRPFYMYLQLAETLMQEEKSELILEVSDEEAGWISVFGAPCPPPVYGGNWYRNIPIKIKAHAGPGWKFVRWEGTFQSQNDSLSITLEDHAILHAVFEPHEMPLVVISEIHYNPSTDLQGADEDFEFIELVNWEQETIDLSGYTFTDGIGFTFPPGTYLEPGEYIILAANPGTYAGLGARVFQITDGRLDNAGEILSLTDQEGMLVDNVHFDDHYPWPRKPDGEGPSLELIHPSMDNSRAGSWKESEQSGGTPGAGLTGVDVLEWIAPDTGFLSAWPNPFSSNLTIEYILPAESRITIRILNAIGQEVNRIPSGIQGPGFHEIVWAPGDLPAGIYYLHAVFSNTGQTETVLLVKHD